MILLFMAGLMPRGFPVGIHTTGGDAYDEPGIIHGSDYRCRTGINDLLRYEALI